MASSNEERVLENENENNNNRVEIQETSGIIYDSDQESEGSQEIEDLWNYEVLEMISTPAFNIVSDEEYERYYLLPENRDKRPESYETFNKRFHEQIVQEQQEMNDKYERFMAQLEAERKA